MIFIDLLFQGSYYCYSYFNSYFYFSLIIYKYNTPTFYPINKINLVYISNKTTTLSFNTQNRSTSNTFIHYIQVLSVRFVFSRIILLGIILLNIIFFYLLAVMWLISINFCIFYLIFIIKSFWIIINLIINAWISCISKLVK